MLHSNVKQPALLKRSSIVRALVFAVLFGVLGFLVGWFTFAHERGRQLPLRVWPLVMRAQTESVFAKLVPIKQKVLLCTGAGAIVGILLSAVKTKRRGAQA